MALLDHMNENVLKITPYQPGRPIEEAAREIGLDPDEITKIASNECPLGPSPAAKRAMRSAVREMHLYPDGGAYYLRQKVAAKLGVPENHLIFGNGSNEIIEFIGHCLLGPHTSMVMSEHAFVIYKLIGTMMGSEVIEVPMRGLTHDLTAMAKAIRPDTRVVWVCNPNNPTGTLVKQKQIDAFMKRIPDGALVVFDEAYREITLKTMPDSVRYVRENRDVIVLRSFSKAYGLAGLRVGYGVAKPDLIQALEKPRQPFNVNRMAQIAAAAALDDDGFVKRGKRTYRKGIKLLKAFCEERSLRFEPPVANFMLINVGDGQAVFEALWRKGIIVRPMAGYGLPEWIRVSIGTEKDNQSFIDAMTGVIANQG